MSEQSLKITLKDVKIYGLDPTIYKTFENDGKPTKQYLVPLYISESDKNVIDSYLYGKVSKNADGEFLFYGKSKIEIPVFNLQKERIKEPINEVFIADVALLIDEFVNNVGENVRYSKCLAIKYKSKVENEKPKIQEKPLENYEDFFGDETEIKLPESDIKPEAKEPEKELNDLPF